MVQWMFAPLIIGLTFCFHLCWEAFLFLYHYQLRALPQNPGSTKKGNLVLMIGGFSFLASVALAIGLAMISLPGLLITFLLLLFSRLTMMGQWIGIWSLAWLKRWLNF